VGELGHGICSYWNGERLDAEHLAPASLRPSSQLASRGAAGRTAAPERSAPKAPPRFRRGRGEGRFGEGLVVGYATRRNR
jgi:hypothetical protein